MSMLIIHVMKMPMAAMWYCHVVIVTVPLMFWSVPFTIVGLNMSGRMIKKKLRIIKKFKMDSHSRKYLKMKRFSLFFGASSVAYFLTRILTLFLIGIFS